jgi:hypothetical protein
VASRADPEDRAELRPRRAPTHARLVRLTVSCAQLELSTRQFRTRGVGRRSSS